MTTTMKIRLILWEIFIGTEKGKTYSEKTLWFITIRRGGVIGIIVSLILLLLTTPLNAVEWGVVAAGSCSLLGMCLYD